MDRRTFLAASVVATTTVAGCAGSGDRSDSDATTTTESTTTAEPTTTTESPIEGPKHGDDLPEDDEPNDGYPPTFETVPDERTFDDSKFGTLIQDGQKVTAASIDVCYYWYARGEARFVDARGSGQYDTQHVFGAVNSPAEGEVEDDPMTGWPEGDRIVCYCGCPHHLSSIRGAELQKNGYKDVYVLDEGYWQWNNRNYPMAGEAVSDEPSAVTIVGVTDPKYAGETAWAIQESSDQIEATAIGSDGRYSMDLKFEGLTGTTPIYVQTPEYEVRAPLTDLTESVVTGATLD